MTGSSASFFLSHFLASMDAAFWRYNEDALRIVEVRIKEACITPQMLCRQQKDKTVFMCIKA